MQKRGGAMNYRAIIFDLDGTLLDTLQDLALSVNTVLRKHGLEEHPVEAYRYFVGDGIDVMIQRAFPEPMTGKDQLKNLVEEVKNEYSRRWADHTKPYPGVPELLNFLEQEKIPKAIFSNKPHEFAVLTVETLLPDWSFINVIGISLEMPCKPDPTGALVIAREMGFDTNQIVYLGDTDTDIQTAIKGGFFPAGALWGFRTSEELEAGGASFLAETPENIIELFRES